MKILIVFFAITILNTSFLIYQSDMNSYIRENYFIKATAEECAAGASLFYDEEALAEGYYVFDREECEKYVQYVIQQNFPDMENIIYEIIYYDNPGTEDPGIEVTISSKDKDRFRLSFLEKYRIKRGAYYEYEGY